MRLTLALLAVWAAVPVRAQDAVSLPVPVEASAPADPLALVLTDYSAPADAAAVAAPPSAPGENGERLAKVQSDLTVTAAGFEALRAPEQDGRARELAAGKLAPELAPFFKDRDAALDAVYRTLAVADYTWALRFPEPPCAPRDRRLALLKSRDGLFSDPATGKSSPWLSALLGPASYGRAAEDALDRASAAEGLSPAAYERLRLRAARIGAALESPRATGATRAKLYCERADAYERLAQAHRVAGSGAVLAGRSSGGPARESDSVLLLAAPDGKNYRALGAAFLVETDSGAKVVTDSSLFTDPQGLVVFRRPAAGGKLGEPLALTIERFTPGEGPALGHLNKDPGTPALKLSASPAALGDLLTGLGHLRSAGSWTVTQGMVTVSGDGTYQTDALLSPEMAGSPMLNEGGEVVGLVLGRGDQAAVLQPGPLKEFLDGGAARVTDWKSPSNAGSASLLTAARPLDLEAMRAPGGAAIESGLPSQLGGVNWEGGGGLGNFRPHSVPSPSFSYSAPSSFHPSSTGDGVSLPPSAPDHGHHAYDGPVGWNSPAGLVIRLVHWLMTGGPIDLIAKGLNNLPNGASKSSTSAPRAAPHVAHVKVKPPPPPPPPKPKIVGLTLTASPADAVPGQQVTLTAQLQFEGDYKDKAGISVAFDAAGQKAYFGDPKVKARSSRTDAGGRATAVLTLEEDTAAAAREQFDDLERETRRREGDAAPSAPRVSAGENATPTRKVEDAAASALDALDAEESSNEEQETAAQPTESGLGVPGGPAVPLGAVPGIIVQGAGGGFTKAVSIGPRTAQAPLPPTDCVDQLLKARSLIDNAKLMRRSSEAILQGTLVKYGLSYDKFRMAFALLMSPKGSGCRAEPAACRLRANEKDWELAKASYGQVQVFDQLLVSREGSFAELQKACGTADEDGPAKKKKKEEKKEAENLNKSEKKKVGKNEPEGEGAEGNGSGVQKGLSGESSFERTRPSRAPDPLAKPGGTPKMISPNETKIENINGIRGENEAAVVLARNGYEIEQLRDGSKAGPNPDYRIEGKIFDCYTPQTANVRNIATNIESKIRELQTERIVLNLKNSAVTLDAIKNQLQRYPIPGLKEIIVVRGTAVIHL